MTLKGVETTASGNSIILSLFSVTSTDIMASLPGGARWQMTQRTDGGAFEDDPLKRLIGVGVVITGIVNNDGNQGGWDGTP